MWDYFNSPIFLPFIFFFILLTYHNEKLYDMRIYKWVKLGMQCNIFAKYVRENQEQVICKMRYMLCPHVQLISVCGMQFTKCDLRTASYVMQASCEMHHAKCESTV